MKSERNLLRAACLLATVALQLSTSALAQGGSAPAAPSETKLGSYIASGSFEFGGRFTDVKGAKYACAPGSQDRSSAGFCEDESMYNTFVNLHTGARLLEQTLSLRAPGNTGVLFDNLFLSSFGWGGDPNAVARLRISKSKAYNFTATFRRDQNFFNYNLLANPLNIGGLNAAGAPFFNPSNISLVPGTAANQFLVANSPHYSSTVRRMGDADLTIAPLSVITVRLGYSSNRVIGPFGWSFHMPMGTDINPASEWNNNINMYRAGVDLKFLPKTTISLDGFYVHNQIAMFGQDRNLFFTLGGTPADFGISWNIPASQPCAASALFTATCNFARAYFLTNKYRTTIPTEQLSFQSHPSKRIDLSGRFTYSHSHMDGLYSHFWLGKVRTSLAQTITAKPKNRREAGEANVGVTIHLTDKLRVSDYFRWFNWRVPSSGLITTATTPVTGAPTNVGTFFVAFWKEERKENEAELEYDFTHAIGARVGYRYTHRFLFDRDESADVDPSQEGPPAPGEFDTGAPDQGKAMMHTGLFGLWIRPNEKFRANFDMEVTRTGVSVAGDEFTGTTASSFVVGNLTRITPRQEQQYRGRISYTPRRWAVLSGSFNFNKQTNNTPTDSFVFRNRNGGFAAMLVPSDRYSFDLSYNWNGYQQNAFICPIGLLPGLPFGEPITSAVCPGVPGYYQTLGRFDNVVQFVSALARFKVIPRVTFTAGYSLVNSDGSQLYTDALMVPGTVKSNFHRPLADIELGITKNVAAKAGWNYYGYNEKAFFGPTLPRDFHANTGTVSLRYQF